MAVIVGDKLKLSNYSYLLQRDGKGFIENLQNSERRDREEKLIDAVDIDWRPFRFKNFSYVSTAGKATYTYVTDPGDLFDTERLIDWISYSYSMGKNLDFYGYIFHNRQTNLTVDFARPTMLTNVGWVDKDSRIIGYTFWPAVGSISAIKTLDKTGCQNVFINNTGEIFNDYVNNEAPGTYAHAEGYQTHGTGHSSHAEGFGTFAEGDYSHAEGGQTHAVGNYSHAGGRDSFANGNYSFAHGDAVKANSLYSVAFGSKTIAQGGMSFAEGGGFRTIDGKPYFTVAAGSASHAEGTATYAGGTNSHAEGNYTYATGNYSHSEGYETKASGESSHAEGKSTTASGLDSHAEGISTISSGDHSHSEGSASQSTGFASHSEGQLSEARGAASHAEGLQTLAGGDYSHVEGESNEALGKDSHAEGYNNVTGAQYSHIEGSNNTMNEFSTNSHVEGLGNEVTTSHTSHIEGEYNVVKNSNTSHISGNNNNISGTTLSLIHGSNNTTSSSTNIVVLGEKNEVTAKKSSLIGTLSKITSSAEYSQVFGTNSYTTKSYVSILGNNSYSLGAYSILIGNNIGTSKENSTLFGAYISVGSNSSVPVSVGRNIFSNHESPLSIGINVTNNGRSGSIAIGYGLFLNNVNGQKFVTGKFNEILTAGYQFAIGDGQSIEQRHNAFVTTDNNWSYVTALATYINNITTTEQNVAITYETNFVHIKSFNTINRGVGGNAGLANKDTNTYNLNFNTYILPTKRYVDKLLAAKDVFRFAGTFTPTDTAWTTNAKDHTVRGTWKPTVAPRTDLDNDEQYSYSYSDKDYSAGAVWKITSTGWFGMTYVMGGDLVISYDDAAKNNNDKGWAVIDTQIAFMENYGTYSTYKGNGALLNDSDKDLRNFFITNINLSDTGYLTYTYAGILTEYRTDDIETSARGLITKTGVDNNKKFLSNIALIRHDDRIELAYTYTDFYSCYTTPVDPQYTNIDVMENENLQFVYNVHLSTDGILSYSKYTMRGFRHHHHLSNADNYWTYAYLSYDTGDDLVYIVSNIDFTYDGHLSYTYTVLSNLRDHHRTRTYDFPNFNNDTRNNESLRVVTNVNLDSNGNLTYTGYDVTNLLNHHHQSHTTNTYNTHNTLLWDSKHPNDDGFGFIGDIQLSTDGKLTYISSYITGLRKHHDTVDMTYTVTKKNGTSYTQTYNLSGAYIGKEAYLNLYDNKFGFVSYVNLDDKGTLTYTVSYVENLRTHHETYHYAPKDNTIHVDNNSNNRGTSYTEGIDDFTFVKNVNLSAEGKLTYYYQTVDKVRTHHNTKTPTETSYKTVHKDNFTFDNSASYSSREEVNEIKIIDNINIDPYGTLTYTVSYLNQLRLHHDNQSKDSLTCTYVSTHKADFEHKDEKLRIDTYTGDVKSTTNPEITEESDRILFINNVNLSKEGKLSYTAKQISRLRDHHDTQATTPTASPISLHNETNLSTATKVTHSNIDTVRINTVNSNDKDEIVYVGNVHLDKHGKLTYTYTKVSKLRSHHDNLSYKTVDYNVDLRKVANSSTLSDGMKVITEVNLSNNGALSYTSYNVTNLKHHHHTLSYIHNTESTGRASYYLERDIDVDGSLCDTTDAVANSNRKIQFLSYAYLSSDGDLTAYYATISNIRRHHHTLSEQNNQRSNNSEKDFDANTSTSNADAHKVLSYAWIDPYGYLTTYYYTLHNLSAHHATSSSKGTDLTTYSWDTTYKFVSYNLNSITDEISFVDGVNLNTNGKLTYRYTKISHLRHHHSYEGKPSTTYNVGEFNATGDDKFGFISGVSMTTDGRLTYTTSSVSNIKTHHGSKSEEGTPYDVFTSNTKGHNEFSFISNVSLDANGQLTYIVSSVTDLRKHHSDGFPISSTASGGNNFVTDVSLSENGYLTGTFGTFSYDGIYQSDGDKNFSAGDEQQIKVVTGIDISGAGKISYTYSVVKNTRNHHTTGTITEGTELKVISKPWEKNLTYIAGAAKHDNAYTDSIKYIDGVNLSKAGTLTYHWTKINHLRSHHRGGFTAIPNKNAIDKLGQNGYFAFIDSISLSPEGELTATSKTVEIPNKVNDADHSGESDHSGSTYKFDHTLTIKHGKYGVSTTVLDKWDGSEDKTVDLNNHGTKTAIAGSPITLNFSDSFNVITNVDLDSTGYLTPTATKFTLPTRNHHSSSTTASGNTFKINTNDDTHSIDVVTSVSTAANGVTTVKTTKILDNLNHHTNDDKTTESGNFISYEYISSAGKLNRTFGKFGANPGTKTATGFTINVNSTNKIAVITGASIDSNGYLSYTYRDICDNVHHHSQNIVITGDFVSGVSLSTEGVLTRSYSKFSNSHDHTGKVATRKVKNIHGPQNGTVIVATYNYIDSTGQLTNRYETIELQNSIFTLNELQNNPNPTCNETFTRSLTLTQTDGTGAGSKNATITRLWDNIWESNVV